MENQVEIEAGPIAKPDQWADLIHKASDFGSLLSRELRDCRDPDVLSEVFSDLAPRFSAEATGQMLMELLNNPISTNPEHMDRDDKVFWAQVAAHIGPDWIEAMRVRAAFMRVVDEFQPR